MPRPPGRAKTGAQSKYAAVEIRLCSDDPARSFRNFRALSAPACKKEKQLESEREKAGQLARAGSLGTLKARRFVFARKLLFLRVIL
jgi:hypothetical protein